MNLEYTQMQSNLFYLKNNFTLEYLPDNFTIEPNKIIFTSGKDGFLKTGMPVAETFLNKKNEIKGIKIVIIIIAYVLIIIISGSINFGVNLKYNPTPIRGINKG